MAPPPNDRAHDVVLFGATGFTGRLVAEYMARHAPADLRWALAGRNRERLEAVRSELTREAPRVAQLPIVVGDVGDQAAMEALAASTRVVCTTVGPYLKYGGPVAAACAQRGTHYCDLTGEVPFMRQSIDRNHADAQRTGARIVHACGFDSIPSDLGVLVLAEHARKKHGRKLAWAKLFVDDSRGGFSGGTVASMMEIVDAARSDKSVRRLLGDPYALDPARVDGPGGAVSGPDGRDRYGMHWDAEGRGWTAPFLMSSVNTRVVRRSNALSGHAYGRAFRYSEAMRFGRGAKAMAMAATVTTVMTAFAAASAMKPTRALLQRTLLPAPGEGPSAETRARGYFVIRLVAETEAEGGAPLRLGAQVEGKSDPGYGETAKMLSEAAMCLARDGAALPPGGGVLTPATAMGMVLVDRLRAAGMVFEARDA